MLHWMKFLYYNNREALFASYYGNLPSLKLSRVLHFWYPVNHQPTSTWLYNSKRFSFAWKWHLFKKKWKKVLGAVIFPSTQHPRQFKESHSPSKLTKICHAVKSITMGKTGAKLFKRIQQTLMSGLAYWQLIHNWWSKWCI